MNCLICNKRTNYYFSKEYTQPNMKEIMQDIGIISYKKCGNCGFVLSETHLNLSKERWSKLNYDYHHYNESLVKKIANQPPYFEQAAMLAIFIKHRIIVDKSWLDYAAGYGALSNILKKYFDLFLPIYDPYILDDDPQRYIKETKIGKHSAVINSAMFEHILTRKDLDDLNALVSPNGCLIIHTVIAESVPKDPDWFYLEPPVHTAFHTNKSMDILMKQWGYTCSIYSPKSKCWVLFKRKPKGIENKIQEINQELQSEWFYYKDGFVDYWK